MPRAKRYIVEGHVYHLTHRCHDRRFHLKFARDRDVLREWLRQAVVRYGVPVYGFCVTSNHIHLIVQVDDREALGEMMNLAASATARQYNRRKGRSGAFWEDTYQATAVESGLHLWRCLRYVDLNMFRAGIIEHPSQWRWCGYDELMGARNRYRILAFDRLMEALGGLHPAQFRDAYEAGIKDAIARDNRFRETAWTESLAVGSRLYVERVAQLSGRRSLRYAQIGVGEAGEAWCVREDSGADAHYGARNRV